MGDNRFIQKIFHSEIIRNSSVLLSSNVLGQLIAFAAYPVLTRIYSEAEYGVFAAFMGVCTVLTTLGTGRYEEALVIAKDKKETISLLGFSLKFLFFFSLTIFIVLALFRNSVLFLFKLEALEAFWAYIPAVVFVTGLYYLLNNLATREKKFKQIAGSTLTQNIVNTVGKLLFGVFGLTHVGQISSNLLAMIIGNYPYRSLKNQVLAAIRGKRQDECQAALRYLDFPKYNMGRTFLSGFSINLPFLILIGFFGDAKIGLFSLAFTLLYRPLNLVANSLYSTLFENSTVTVRERKPFLPSLKKYWKYCFYLIPFFILAFIIAKPLFGFIFGANWEESGTYFQYMLPWMFMGIMVSPLYFVPIIFYKQNQALLIEIIFLLFRFVALWTGIYYQNFETGILLFAIVGFVLTAITFFWFYSLIFKYEKSIISA
ncbi:polysaccharide biosynthesis protein [Bacteroidia bacterium]|nr:polysaccharide biosynthesis protein [Bacteroidia bacterium]